MRSNYYSYTSRRRRSNRVGKPVFLVGLLSATLLLVPNLKKDKADDHFVSEVTPNTIEEVYIPEEIGEEAEVVVAPKWESILSGDLKDNLESYLSDPSHSFEDLEMSGITTTDYLRLRKGPGTEYDIIEELGNEMSLQIMGVCDNDWYLVSAHNNIGFVSGDYIKIFYPEYLESQQIEPTTHFLKAVTATTGVNVRDGAGESFGILGSLEKGQSASAYEKLDNGWYHINYNGQDGYVCGDYVCEVYATSAEDLPLVYTRDSVDFSLDPYGEATAFVPAGEFLRMYGENDDYYMINYNGNYGYISKSHCERMSDYYAIVDISSQNLKVYYMGEEILSTRVVTGKDSTPTRIGYFSIYAKLDHTRMVGEDYDIPMDNVLYFDNGIALHPMNRGEYDYMHDVYHVNGSHGCVNTPPDVMAKVYTYLNVGDRVFVKE